MTAADRRMEIVSILVVSRYFTSKELAQEFGVCVQTIRNDITVFSYGYPIYTKPGLAGEFYYGQLQAVQQYAYIIRAGKTQKMYDVAEGEDKKILECVLRKYGAYKLKL